MHLLKRGVLIPLLMTTACLLAQVITPMELSS